MKKYRFTFHELLLVAAVFVAGVVLTIPVLSSTQEDATAAACADKSRQLGAAFAAFANGNDGFLPRTQLGADQKVDNLWVLWTFDMLRKEFIKADNLICPEGDAMISDNWARNKVNSLKRGSLRNSDVYAYAFYGYNVIGAGGGLAGEKPVKLAGLSNRIILTADSWEGNNYQIARYIGASCIMNRYVKGRGLVYPLHDGKATVLWSDGSVSSEAAGDFPHESWNHGVFAVRSNWVAGK